MHDPHDNHREPSPESLARGHEQTDLSAKAIASFLAILTVIVGFVGIGMAGLYVILTGLEDRQEAPASPLAADQVLPPDPRLQALPAIDLAEMRAQEAAVLKTYGWVSREAQVVRIPVDRAMALVASRGLPVFPITPPTEFQPGSSTGTPAALEPGAPAAPQPAPSAPQAAPPAPAQETAPLALPPAAVEPAPPMETATEAPAPDSAVVVPDSAVVAPATEAPAPQQPAPADVSEPAPAGTEPPAVPEGASQQ